MNRLSDGDAVSANQARAQVESAQSKTALIMMVDDEPIMMELVEAFLEEEGYRNFIQVEHSTQAMETLQQNKPDVLLLDLNMPVVSGFDILQEIRSNPVLQHIPVIVLTSSSDAASKLKALELGATDFLAKPVDASELILRLRNTLAAKAYQDRLEYYDALTGLPNRKLFLDRLNWSIRRDMHSGRGIVVMNIGLDRFKQINDSMGPRAGDELLKQVSGRLLESVRQSDVVSRFGGDEVWTNLSRLSGDEFSLLFPELNSSEDSSYIAQRILESFEAPFLLDGENTYVTASIGIACGPEDGRESDLLIKHAGAATAYAKEQGRNNYQFFSREVNARAKERLELEMDLRNALDNGEFELHYQPKIDAQTGRMVGVEALLRWRHPKRGMVPPATYIDLAEETGLIIPIGDWVIEEACRQNVAWQTAGIPAIKMSVNLSVKQLRAQQLRRVVVRALDASGMDPGLLVLEITEGVVVDDIDNKIKILQEIRDVGVAFSIDDFGTGYSSLSYLRHLPIDELKIDRSFLLDLPDSKKDAAIVKTIIALSRSLELDLVAEGVEERAQLEFLLANGCRVIQGYYFSKPLTAIELLKFVQLRSLQRSA